MPTPHAPRTAPFSSCLLVGAIGLIAGFGAVSCSGGGGGSSAGGPTTPGSQATLDGEWTLFLDGDSCDGPAFEALAMELEDLGQGQFLVRIEDGAETFEFAAAEMEGALFVGGTSTVGATSLELPTAEWTITGNRNKLTGAFVGTRTEAGVDCALDFQVEAFRTDATQASLIRGGWEWTARTSTVTGGCSSVGENQVLGATLWPKRQNQFFVELILADGERTLFSGALVGARLDLFGTDTLASGDEMQIELGSYLTIAPGGVAATGELLVGIEGAAACDYTATLTAARPAVAEPMVPFIRDVEGAQTLMGVAPEDPATPVELVEAMGSEVLGQGASSYSVDRLAELVERPVLEGNEVTLVRDGMVYSAGGDIYWVDLAQRFDVEGGRIVQPPVKVFSGNGASILELTVDVDLAQTTTVIVGHRVGDRVMIELHAIEEAQTSALLSSSTDILGMLMDADGRYRGMATLASSGNELRRISVDQSSELIATGVTGAAVSRGGALYYARPGALFALDPGAAAATALETLTGASYTFGRFAGERLFLGRDDLAGASVLSREAGGTLTELAQTNSVGAGGAAFSPLVPVGDRVVFTMVGGSGTRRLMAVPMAGGAFELLVAFPGSTNYSPTLAQAMGGQAYFTAVPQTTFSVFGIDPAGVVAGEELTDHRLGSPLEESVFPWPGAPSLTGLTLLGENGDVRVLQRSEPVNGTLASSNLVFSATMPGALVTVASHGGALLVADESATQPGDQSAAMYWVDPSGMAAPVLVSGEAGEFNLPVR